MKALLKAKLINGEPIEFNPFDVKFVGDCNPYGVVYVKYKGASYPLQTKSIQFVNVKK